MSSEPSHRKDYPQLRKSPGWPSSREGVTCTRGSFSLNQRGVYVTAEGLTASVEEANRRRLPTVWFQLLFHSGKGKTVETVNDQVVKSKMERSELAEHRRFLEH